MTAITPTPLGEGKTTTSIGLVQGLNRIGHRAAVCIRQPSLGPVFGIKGGAAGGGYSQVIPMEDFNLHLTGDNHAVGAAHNLLAAFIDNSLMHGNTLGIDPLGVLWPRVVDISDRAVRKAIVGLGGRENGYPRETEWQITVASEVMAVLALASDIHDLRARLGRMVVATTFDGRRITAEDLQCAGSMTVLLRDAIKPNLLQTLEGRPGIRPLRPVRQHRPRQQQHPGRPPCPGHLRDRLHRGRLRRGHGRREVLRHQVPPERIAARRGGDGRHCSGAQDAWRRGPDRGRQAARPGPDRRERRRGAGGLGQPRRPDRERPRLQSFRSWWR